MKNDSSRSITSNKMSGRNEKDRCKAPIKIVLRRLPPAMTWEQLKTQLDPIPAYEFAQFVAAKSSGGISFSRAYFVFKDENDISPFKERFNGYVFVDSQGGESVGIVELAPNPKVPHDELETAKKRDSTCGTIESDHEYKKFLSEQENPQKPEPISLEQLIKEIDEKEKMAAKNAVQETPLTDYIIKKNEDRLRNLEEKWRARERERRERVRNRLEQEAKERKENKDRKITEFRNSRFERSYDGPPKNKERLARGRINRFGDSYRNDKDELENEGLDDDRGKRTHSSIKESDATENRNRDGNGKWKDEKSNWKKETYRNSEAISEKDGTPKEVAKAKSTKSTTEVSKMVANRRATIKNLPTAVGNDGESKGKEVQMKEKPDGIGKESSRPRRNKDRPERAIYQPGAARRRVAALAASTTATTTKEKP